MFSKRSELMKKQSRDVYERFCSPSSQQVRPRTSPPPSQDVRRISRTAPPPSLSQDVHHTSPPPSRHQDGHFQQVHSWKVVLEASSDNYMEMCLQGTLSMRMTAEINVKSPSDGEFKCPHKDNVSMVSN
jgi:hypothetical protein